MDADQHDSTVNCRFCGTRLRHTFLDLGMSPLCESYVSADRLDEMEPFYPLHVYVCHSCLLVQLREYVKPVDIFSDYAYFSSYSDTWVEHARQYTAAIKDRLSLGSGSRVVEIASNDGYLLQHFVMLGIPVLGIEPAANVAEVARQKGIPTLVEFFGASLARKLSRDYGRADLVVGNNVLAQVPDLNDFVEGIQILLSDQGVLTLEFPHLMCLVEQNQFDTIYHEHFSYFSFLAAERILDAHAIRIFDVDEIPTHGGSLRIYGERKDTGSRTVTDRVHQLRRRELDAGFGEVRSYLHFAESVHETKRCLLEFLIGARRAGKSVVGYGAPGKGNTLLNYCGIRTDFLNYTVDRSPHKQGKFLPGTHIPIHHPDRIKETRPDYVLILPWNFKEEIMCQISYIREWGGQFVIPIPGLAVLP